MSSPRGTSVDSRNFLSQVDRQPTKLGRQRKGDVRRSRCTLQILRAHQFPARFGSNGPQGSRTLGHGNVDTPSGARGRRGRWHEILSKFDLEIEYLPGQENVVADAMSRWAYPATSERQDVSWHGTKGAKDDVQKQLAQEFRESPALLFLQTNPKKLQLIGEGSVEEQFFHLRPLTRFKFWADMSPEEREEVHRERASGNLPGLPTPSRIPPWGVPFQSPRGRENPQHPRLVSDSHLDAQKLLPPQGSTY